MVIVIVKKAPTSGTHVCTLPAMRESGPHVGLESAVLGQKLQGLTFPGSQMDPPKYENEIPSRLSILSIHRLRLIFEPHGFELVLLSHLLDRGPITLKIQMSLRPWAVFIST